MKRGKKLRRRGGFVKKKKGEKRIRKTVVKRRINTGKGRRPKKSDGSVKRKKNASLGRMRQRRSDVYGKRRRRKKNGAKLRRRELLVRKGKGRRKRIESRK